MAFFFWSMKGTAHYGRFTKIDRPARIEHTWMSPNTSGLESNVSISFQKKGESTLMILEHSGLPNTEGGKSHQQGWTFFLDQLASELEKQLSGRK
jgi:uncharacterized protein YndB with AHSA1/START domain